MFVRFFNLHYNWHCIVHSKRSINELKVITKLEFLELKKIVDSKEQDVHVHEIWEQSNNEHNNNILRVLFSLLPHIPVIEKPTMKFNLTVKIRFPIFIFLHISIIQIDSASIWNEKNKFPHWKVAVNRFFWYKWNGWVKFVV
jgi:hypothetical protein